MFAEWNDQFLDVPGAVGRGDTPVYPPRGILHAAALVLMLDTALLAAPSDLAHWLGYALAAFAVPIIVLLYRHLTIARSTKPLFVAKPAQARVAGTLIAASIALSTVHAFLALQETVIR